MNFIRRSAWLVVLLALAGCATPETRIRKNPELFAGFPPDTQSKIRQGHIAIGFTQDEVRMALGDPSRTYRRITTNDSMEVWSYTSYDYRSDPQFVTVLSPGFHRRFYRSAMPNVMLVDVPQQIEYEALRVEFEGDRVKTIEAIRR